MVSKRATVAAYSSGFKLIVAIAVVLVAAIATIVSKAIETIVPNGVVSEIYKCVEQYKNSQVHQ